MEDWLARSYFIPGGASQSRGGRAPPLRVTRCRTTSGRVGLSQDTLGLMGSRMGAYVNRTLMRDSRVIRRDPFGFGVVKTFYQFQMEFHQNPDSA